MSNLNLKVSERNGSYEGTVTIAGLRPTKLVKNDGQTTYATRSAVTQAASAVAKKLNLNVESSQATSKVVAAKKTSKIVAAKKSSSSK